MAKCSFGKVSIKGLFKQEWEEFGTDLHARLFYIGTENTEVLLVAMDTLETFPKECTHFRNTVSGLTGIPADNIWYHELQLHAAPHSSMLAGDYMESIAQKVGEEAAKMKANAVPFTCEVTEAYAGRKYTINREQYVAGLGGVTIWAGMKFDENGLPYCNDPGRMLLRGYTPELPVFNERIPFDNNVDPLAYLFAFYDESGRMIGTISRFAAHPDIAVLFESHGVLDEYRYNYDWPGYMTEKIEGALGAPSMYVNGPCANLATKKTFDGMVTYEKSAAEAQRVGEEIADFLLENFTAKKRVPLGDADNLKAAHFLFEMDLHEDFPHSLEEMEKNPQRVEAAEQAMREAIVRNAPAYEVKQLIDKRWRSEKPPEFMQVVGGFDEETLVRHTAIVSVTVMRLGDYLFFGVPGESLVEMTEWLRSTYTGRKTIPLDQVNGYYSYVATPASLNLGGYTNWYSWNSRASVPKLKEDIQKAMEDFLD